MATLQVRQQGLPGSKEHHADADGGASGRFGDLTGRHPFAVVQPQCGPLFGRQDAVRQAPELRPLFAFGDDGRCVMAAIDQVAERFVQPLPAAYRTSLVVGRQIEGDREQPTAKPALGVELSDAIVRTPHCLLGDVFGVVAMAETTPHQVQDAIAAAPIEFGETRLAPPLHLQGELLIAGSAKQSVHFQA